MQQPRLNSIFKQLMSIHWWMAMFYLILLASGWIMLKLDDKISWRELMFAAHKSLGVLVLLLLGWRLYLLVRVWARKYSKRFPKLTGNWYFKTALHSLLYLMMLIVPLSGYWLANAYAANNVNLFGVPMPDIFPADSDAISSASAAHSRTSKAFAIAIFIHALCQYKAIRANWRRFSNWLPLHESS